MDDLTVHENIRQPIYYLPDQEPADAQKILHCHELVESGKIKLVHCVPEDMVADIFAKELHIGSLSNLDS